MYRYPSPGKISHRDNLVARRGFLLILQSFAQLRDVTLIDRDATSGACLISLVRSIGGFHCHGKVIRLAIVISSSIQA